MTREAIMDKLKEIMAFTVKDPERVLADVTEESDLYTTLGLTSVGILYSAIAMEEAFQIRFEKIEDFQKVGDVIDYIQSYTAL